MKSLVVLMLLLPSFAFADRSPVGLGIYIADGVYSEALDPNLPSQLHVLDDSRPRYVSEFDVVQSANTSDALGLAPVMAAGAFAYLNWSGVHQVPCHPDGALEDWRLEIDGAHWMRSWCYKGAAWMEDSALIVVESSSDRVGGSGCPLVGAASAFWEDRRVARVVAHGCAAVGDCSGATVRAEALLQLRGNLSPRVTAAALPWTTQALDVRVVISGRAIKVATVPVVLDTPSASVGYGLNAQLVRETPYPARGYFVAGEQVTLRATFTDGDNHRLHSVGGLPSYGAALFGDPAALGLRYLTFTDDPVLYWAHKNTQSDMTFTVAGPLDKMRSVGSTPITVADAFLPQIPTATAAVDGWAGFVQIFPPTYLVFPCLGSLAMTGSPGPECFQQVSDAFTVTVPADAQPGTWLATVKARRVWEGEPVQAAASVKFQVGRTVPTGFTPRMSGCARCHVGQSSLVLVGHGFDVGNHERPECLSCHTSGYASWFEPDAGFDKRMSFIHLLSEKFFSMGGRARDVTY